MKNICTWIGIGLVALGIASCTGTSYSKLRKEERQLINDYISRNGYEITHELPPDSVFLQNKNLYYCMYNANYGDDLYYRLEKLGDTTSAAVKPSQRVNMRYMEYKLTIPSDTISNWTTLNGANPVEFLYLTDYTSAPVAWHLAVSLMQYSGSECKIICPSKLNNVSAQYSVTPYGYTLQLKFHP